MSIKFGVCADLHVDSAENVDGVWYYTVNCMSNMWVGDKWQKTDRYPAEIYEKYPSIKYVTPYEKSQFAIITMDENGAQIKGTDGGFVGASPPEEMGKNAYGDTIEEKNITSTVKDRYLKF